MNPIRRMLLTLFGAVAGAWVGFALVFYGYLLFHPPGPSRVEFEFASTLGFFVGGPLGTIVGSFLGYRSGKVARI